VTRRTDEFVSLTTAVAIRQTIVVVMTALPDTFKAPSLSLGV